MVLFVDLCNRLVQFGGNMGREEAVVLFPNICWQNIKIITKDGCWTQF
jgi:hypothetical protein